MKLESAMHHRGVYRDDDRDAISLTENVLPAFLRTIRSSECSWPCRGGEVKRLHEKAAWKRLGRAPR